MRRWAIHPEGIDHDYKLLNELWRFERNESYVCLSYGLHRQLRNHRPGVLVVGGWDQVAHLWGYALRCLHDYRFLWWVESTKRDFRVGRGGTKRLKRGLIRGSDGVLVPGRASRDYVRSLGCARIGSS